MILENSADDFSDEIVRLQEPYSSAFYTYLSVQNEPSLLSQFRYRKGDIRLHGSLKMQQRDAKSQFQIAYRDLLALGNYRLAWAQGLILSRDSGKSNLIHPGHPQSYQPQGIAVQYQWGNLGIMGLASAQRRDATLEEGRIKLLPRTKGTYLGSTSERIYSAALSYKPGIMDLGALYYHQSYDRGFADAATDSLLQALSMYLKLKSAGHDIRVECAIEQRASIAASWGMQYGDVFQELQYKRLQAYQRPAYASRIMTLSQRQSSEELSACLTYKSRKSLEIRTQSTINRAWEDLKDSSWLGRHSLVVSLSEAPVHLSASLTGIDREILSAIDSTYCSSIPTHYRIKLSWAQQLGLGLNVRSSFRYHHQEKALALSSGSWWEQNLSYHRGSSLISLACSIWNSGSFPLLIPDESDSGYSRLCSNSAMLKLKAQHGFGSFTCCATLKQELGDNGQSSILLQLSWMP